MDAESSYNLEIWIVAPNSHARWFSLNKVVDADRTNFTDLVAKVVDKYPHNYGDIVRLFYFCMIVKRTSKSALTKIWLKCLQNIRIPNAAC